MSPVTPMPPYIETLHELVDRWSFLGVQEYGDGTRLVGHLPGRGIGAYLHHLFGPLPEKLVEELEDRLGVRIPGALREFYRYHNGCVLFDQSVYVFGVRRSYDRADFDAMACNPFDIVAPAVVNFPRSPSGRGITICKYEDRSIVLLEPDGKVIRILTEGAHRIANTWSGFGDWLLSEYRRLEQLYDKNGACLVEALDTPPPHSIA